MDGAGFYLLHRSAGSSQGPSSLQGSWMLSQGCGSLLHPQALTLRGTLAGPCKNAVDVAYGRNPELFQNIYKTGKRALVQLLPIIYGTD